MELSVEEKAQRYDEAIEQLKAMMPNWERLSYTGKTFLQDLTYILPELKESEDEMIRRVLIQETKGSEVRLFEAVTNEEFIAWLEKKGEKPQGKSALEAINEEKVDNANKVEPDKCEGCNNAKGCVACVDGSEWAHIEEQNPAWSERDDSNLERAIWYIENPAPMVVKDSMLVFWLKSLKERVGHFDDGYKVGFSAAKRNQWKPSEHELEVLKLAAEKDGTCLMGLYKHLKELKG